MMLVRALTFALLVLLSGVASATIGCNGQAFGQVVRPFTGMSSDDMGMFSTWVPEGKKPPIHGITVGSWGWMCSTTVTVDMDAAALYRLETCRIDPTEHSVEKSNVPKGAVVQRVHADDGSVFDQVTATSALTPDEVHRLVCLANQAWRLDKYGDPVRYDIDGKPLDPDGRMPTPPHGVRFMHLKDSEVDKLIGGQYPYPETGPASELSRYVWGLSRR